MAKKKLSIKPKTKLPKKGDVGLNYNTFPVDNTAVNKVYGDSSKKGYQSPMTKEKQNWYDKSSGRIEESMSPLDVIPMGALNTGSKLINNAYKLYSNYNKFADFVNGYELYNDIDKLPSSSQQLTTTVKKNGGLLKAGNGLNTLIKDPRQDSYYTPSSSDRNIQQNIIKQQEINKIKNQIDFPLYKSNENTKELKTQIGDQSEILKNVVFKDQLPEYVRLIKNHPEQENLWKKETLERAKNYENDTSKYLAALQLLKENGSPYLTQNSYFEDKYRKNKNSPTSNFRASKNLMYLEPNDRDAFIAELSHAQQLKDNFLEDKNVSQKLDSIYKKQKQTNPNIDYHEVYDKYYYNMPNSIEYDAHTLRQPKLKERYYFLTDSFKNELPFMSFTPQYKVNEKIKLDNAGKDYYKGNIGNLRRIINKGVDNIFGTDIYKAFGNDPKKYKSGGSIKTDPKGYWNKDNHGKPVRIPSNRITMKGVNQPLLGISDTGDIQMMSPGMEYSFDGNSVTEFPVTMQQGGNVRQPIKGTKEQYQAYQDSLDLYTANRDRLVQLERESRYATNMFGQSGLYNNGLLSEHYTYLPPHRVTHNQYSLTNVPSNYENGNDRTYWGFENRRSNVTINPITYHGFDRRFRQNVIRGTNQTVNLPGQNDLHEYAGIWQFPQPVQPIIYQPEDRFAGQIMVDSPNNPPANGIGFRRQISQLPRPKEKPINIELAKPDLLSLPDINMFNPIPFEKGTYFTRPRQSQELEQGKTDYFDKKTGKLLGTYKNGGKVKNSDWELI